jgi:hypothetical protein
MILYLIGRALFLRLTPSGTPNPAATAAVMVDIDDTVSPATSPRSSARALPLNAIRRRGHSTVEEAIT